MHLSLLRYTPTTQQSKFRWEFLYQRIDHSGQYTKLSNSMAWDSLHDHLQRQGANSDIGQIMQHKVLVQTRLLKRYSSNRLWQPIKTALAQAHTIHPPYPNSFSDWLEKYWQRLPFIANTHSSCFMEDTVQTRKSTLTQALLCRREDLTDRTVYLSLAGRQDHLSRSGGHY